MLCYLASSLVALRGYRHSTVYGRIMRGHSQFCLLFLTWMFELD